MVLSLKQNVTLAIVKTAPFNIVPKQSKEYHARAGKNGISPKVTAVRFLTLSGWLRNMGTKRMSMAGRSRRFRMPKVEGDNKMKGAICYVASLAFAAYMVTVTGSNIWAWLIFAGIILSQY